MFKFEKTRLIWTNLASCQNIELRIKAGDTLSDCKQKNPSSVKFEGTINCLKLEIFYESYHRCINKKPNLSSL